MQPVQQAKAAYFVALALLGGGCASARENATKPSDGPTPSNGCIARVAATYDFVVLVRRTDGTLWASATGADYAPIADANGPLIATDIAASGSSAYGDAIGCALLSGKPWCFPIAGPLIDSTNLGASLGFGVTTTFAQQVARSAGGEPVTDILQLAGGMNGSGASFCGVARDGSAWCWGYNSGGLLGHGDDDSVTFARPVWSAPGKGFTDAVEVRVGFSSSCARKSDGSVWCWGDNSYGQLGVAPEVMGESLFPVAIALPGPATRLAASPGNTQCAILEDTSVRCWGRNEYAEAGAPDDQLTVLPTVITTAADGSPLRDVLDLAPDRGMKAMCANTSKSGLMCWGDTNGPNAVAVARADAAELGAITVPLAAFGARDGKLIYVNAQGELVFGAGSLPAEQQPPCP